MPSPTSCGRAQYDTVGRLAAQGKGGIAGLLCPGLLLPINSRSATSTASDDRGVVYRYSSGSQVGIA